MGCVQETDLVARADCALAGANLSCLVTSLACLADAFRGRFGYLYVFRLFNITSGVTHSSDERLQVVGQAFDHVVPA